MVQVIVPDDGGGGKTFTIYFDSNGGDIPDYTSKQVTYNAKVGNLPNVSWDQHKFLGWYTSKVGGTRVTTTTIYTRNANATYYAHWKIVQYKVTLVRSGGDASCKLEIGGTSSSTADLDYNSTHTIYAYTTSGSNYKFSYWEWSGGKSTKSSLSITVPARDITYTAVFIIRKYTVTFDGNGCPNSPSISSKTVKKGQAFGDLATIKWDDYHIFNGWRLKDGSLVTSETIFSYDEDLTLYASWQIKTRYHLYYWFNDGTSNYALREQDADADEVEFTIDVSPGRKGYALLGWASSSSATTVEWTSSITLHRDSSTDEDIYKYVYAVWKDVQYHFILYLKFNNGDTSIDYAKLTGENTSGISYPFEIPSDAPTWTDHTFNGWYDNTSGSGHSYRSRDQYRVECTSGAGGTSTATLYAGWTFDIYFDSNGGGAPEYTSKTVTYNAQVEDLPNVSWDHHKFLGWYTSEVGGTQLTTATTCDMAAGTIYYAHWEIITYLIDFKVDSTETSSKIYGKPTEQSDSYVPYGSVVTISGNTLKVGHINIYAQDDTGKMGFLKWSLRNGDKITSNTTITAYFKKVADLCTLTFVPTVVDGDIVASYAPGVIYDSDGVELLGNEIILVKGDSYQFSTTPNLGYVLKSWSSSSSGGIIIDDSGKSTCTIKVQTWFNSTGTIKVNFRKNYATIRVGFLETAPELSKPDLPDGVQGIITGSFTYVDGTTEQITFVENSPYKIWYGATGTFTWSPSSETAKEFITFRGWYHNVSSTEIKNKKEAAISAQTQKVSSSQVWSITIDPRFLPYNWILYYSTRPKGSLKVRTHIYPEGSGSVSYSKSGTGSIFKGDTINFIVTPSKGYELRGAYVSGSSSAISWNQLVFSYTIPQDYEYEHDFIIFTFKFAFKLSTWLSPRNTTGYRWKTGERDHMLESGEAGAGVGNWYYPGERFHRYIEAVNEKEAKKYQYLSSTYDTGSKIQIWTKTTEIEFYPSASGDVTANFKSLEGITYRLVIKCVDKNGKDASDYVDITPGADDKYAVTQDSTGKLIYPIISVKCTIKSEYQDKYEFSHWKDNNSSSTSRRVTLTGDTELIAVIDDLTYFVQRADSSDINKYNIYYWSRYEEYHPPEGYNPYGGKNTNPLINPAIKGNCTWYAWGRTCELAVVDLGSVHEGCRWTGNAKEWFSSAFRTGGDTWEREGESDPTVDPGREISYWNVGDILCFTGYYGHVAIVEAINGDELTISESGFKITQGYFWKEVTHPKFTLNEEWDGGVRFQGVIHNPYVGKSKAIRVTTIAMPTDAGSAALGKSKASTNSKTMIVSKGSTVYFSAIVNEGHKFSGWYLNGEDSPISTSLQFSQNMGESTTLIACFDGYNPKDYVQINAYPSPEDSGVVTGGGTYRKGDLVVLVAEEEIYDEDGNLIWYFSNWSDGTTTPIYEFNAHESVTLYANYSQDSESRDQGANMPLSDFYTTYGEDSTISVKSITINATLYKYNADFNSTTNQIRPAMTLYIGDQSYEIDQSNAGTPYTITFSDDQIIETKNIKLVLSGDYSSEEYNSFNLNSIDISYLGWDPESGTRVYHRYYNGTKWTEWEEEK